MLAMMRLLSLFALGVAHTLAFAQACLYSVPPPGSVWSITIDEATDTSTGLIWKRCPEGQTWSGSACTGTAQTATWATALGLANAQAAGGWRLPNAKELHSMVDAACTASTDPAANPVAFPGHPKTSFWSSTAGWAVNFSDGSLASGQAATTLMNVRLVRGGNAQNDYAAGHGADASCDMSIPGDRPTSALLENADGTVTDSSTGLTWARCAVGMSWSGGRCINPASSLNWQAALGAAAIAGADWRLPSAKELGSLADQRCTLPAINGQKFPDTPVASFWSSTPGWAVSFTDGALASGQAAATTMNARLVRGGNAMGNYDAGHGADANCDMSIPGDRPTSALLENLDGTVTDSSTGLTWARCAVGMSWSGGRCINAASSVTWQSALAAASSAGADWRLPNAKELASLVDSRCALPALNGQKFPDTPAASFWSATPGWAVNFSDGALASGQTATTMMNARLVRDGNADAAYRSASSAGRCTTDIPGDFVRANWLVNVDGTANDRAAGLVWDRCLQGQLWDGSNCTGTPATYTWSAALLLARAATSYGQSSWRLPNVKELDSITDRRCTDPALHPEVFRTPPGTTWTSTPGWAVSSVDGSLLSSQAASAAYTVRLVREGGAAAILLPPVLNAPGATTAPGPDLSTLTPVFGWQSVAGATGYGLYIRDVMSNALVYPNVAGTTAAPLTGNSLALPAGYLQPSHQYKWNMTSFLNGTEFVPDTGTNPSRWFQTTVIDTAAPNLSVVSLSGIGLTAASLIATSDEAATGFWLAVAAGATAPSAAQVKSGVNYAGVTIAASGYGAMTATVPRSFTVSGLAAGTGYDFYVVAMDASANLSAAPVKVQGSTLTVAAAPVVASFAFDPVADQAAGVPVPVRIRAVDPSGVTLTGFNDIVQVLGLNSAKVTPKTLKFTGGVAVASVSYLGSGVARLSAQYNMPAGAGVVGGASNQFLLTSAVAQTFTVTGRTIVGTIVQLVSTGSGGLLGPVATDANGAFVFPNVPVGEWQVLATPTQAGYSQVCQTPQHCRVIVNGNITFNPEMRNGCQIGSTAVILIPGIMGSTLRKDINTAGNISVRLSTKAPQLSKEYPTPARNLEIYDPALPNFAGAFSDGTAMGHSLLINDLENAGFCVLPTPWDWRMPFKDAADTYLKPAIASGKAITGRKVYIVAHSMGGLVARSYIEQWNGGQDVERLIMLGTPNYGATNAYYLMEGGDPKELDELTNSIPAMFATIKFYSAAANELYQTEFGDDLVLIDETPSRYKWGNNPTQMVGTFLNTMARGGKDLLPTYDFLRKWTRGPILMSTASDILNCRNSGTLQPNPGLNTNLGALNGTFNFTNYYAPVDGNVATPTKTQVRILLSNSQRTLKELCYANAKVGAYRYGAPDPGPNGLATGDGTVLLAEGRGPFTQPNIVSAGNFGKHTDLLGNAYSRCQVMSALLAAPSVQSSCMAPALAAVKLATVSTVVSQASIAINSQYAALLTASDGKRVGAVKGVTGIFEEIVNSVVGISPYQAHVIQQSPINGTYHLQISNDSTLANTAVRLSLDYLQAGVDTQTESVRILVKATPYLADIVQDSAAARWMVLVDPVKPPLALKAVPQTDLTQLSWTAPVDATVTGYNIYYRPTDDDRFQLLGQTAGTAFTTAIPWAGNFDSSNEFIVLSTNAAGVESPIRSGNSVRNVSYARAAFSAAGVNASGVIDQTTYPLSVTFIDQSDATAAIQSWAWDFNSDGVVDSTAQNPTFSFPLVGSYTVSLTVTSADGSTDTKVFQNFVNIRTLPDAPTMGAAGAGDAQALVSFTAPANDGNSVISAYTVTCVASGQTTQSTTGAASPLGVTGLTNGVPYTCAVTATNGVGTGAASAAVAVTPVAANTPVCTLTATPASIAAGASATLSSSCTLAPTSYVWTGGTCAGTTAASCTVAPLVTTTYDVAGVNANGLGSVVSATVTVVPAAPPTLSNISTRGQVRTADNVMIGGFIISGSTPKTVLIRARGPSLTPFGVVGALANPTVGLYSGSTNIASNDNWGSAANAADITATGLAPTNSFESAILTTLPPGPYTAIVSGVGSTSGVGIVEVLEIDNPASPLSNISTRGRVETGASVLIGGFIISGTTPKTVLIRARGPSLTPFGVVGALANPMMSLYSGSTVLASNDNWGTAVNAADITATGLAPTNALESAILTTLPPGAYTVIVQGVGSTSGVGIVEVLAQ